MDGCGCIWVAMESCVMVAVDTKWVLDERELGHLEVEVGMERDFFEDSAQEEKRRERIYTLDQHREQKFKEM